MATLLNNGHHPFYNSSLQESEVKSKISKGELGLSEINCSEQAKSLLYSLLNIYPRERASAASALLHPWLKPSTTGLSKYDSGATLFTVSQNEQKASVVLRGLMILAYLKNKQKSTNRRQSKIVFSKKLSNYDEARTSETHSKHESAGVSAGTAATAGTTQSASKTLSHPLNRSHLTGKIQSRGILKTRDRTTNQSFLKSGPRNRPSSNFRHESTLPAEKPKMAMSSLIDCKEKGQRLSFSKIDSLGKLAPSSSKVFARRLNLEDSLGVTRGSHVSSHTSAQTGPGLAKPVSLKRTNAMIERFRMSPTKLKRSAVKA